MSEPVRTEVDNGVLLITLDRPPANAVDVAASRALYSAFERLRDDSELRAAVITGGGERFFCAGWDLKAAADGEAADADHGPGGFAGLTEMFELNKPVIAAVNGLAIGGGFELALSADLLVAAEHTEFALPEVGLGLVPDSGGLLRLPKRLPSVVANEMLLTGRRMSAAEAAQWGLLNQVAASADVLDTAVTLARRICAAAPLAVAAVKEVTRATEAVSVSAGYEVMRGADMPAYQSVLNSEDATEGARAFTEKREPQWRGR